MPGDLGADGFESPINDYYMANAICRASAVMAECSRLYTGAGGTGEATGTDG
jgi:hypothetical protein